MMPFFFYLRDVSLAFDSFGRQHNGGDREIGFFINYNIMSGSLSTPDLPATKRPTSPTSGSNKRPRLEDDPWMRCPDYLDDAYEKLLPTDFQSIMVRGSARAQRLLLSKRTEISGPLTLKLEELIASFADLLTSVRKWGNEAPDEERLRLVYLAKQILVDWQGIENAIPPPLEQTSDSWLCMAPVDYPQPVPSAWLFELYWRDEALEEVQSIRKKYSYLLDQAFRDSYTSYLKKNGVSGSTALLHKKLLKFVASSRVDIAFMSVRKCYKRVMSIKEICASGNLTAQTQLHNWRDEIYDQIVAYRNMYSPKLDELFRDEFYKLRAQSTTLGEVDKTRFSFLAESLRFLAYFRDSVAFLPEDGCRKQLDAIKQFMEKEGDSLPAAKQATAEACGQTQVTNGLTIWRDLEYEQLQNKRLRFMYQLYDVYLKYKSTWSKMPVCEEDLKKLESHLEKALDFYRIPRCEMSLWESKEDYYKLFDGLQETVVESIGLIKLLLGRLEEEGSKPGWDCSRFILLPKRWKLSDRFRNLRQALY